MKGYVIYFFECKVFISNNCESCDQSVTVELLVSAEESRALVVTCPVCSPAVYSAVGPLSAV